MKRGDNSLSALNGKVHSTTSKRYKTEKLIHLTRTSQSMSFLYQGDYFSFSRSASISAILPETTFSKWRKSDSIFCFTSTS